MNSKRKLSYTGPKLEYLYPSINEDLSKKLVDENIKISLSIKVDMKKIKSDDVNSMNKHILAVNGLAKEIIDNSVNGKTKNNKQGVTYNYIYVVQRNDGMVIVVGKSRFELVNGKVSSTRNYCGDLYHELNLGNGQVGTEKIIVESLFDFNILSDIENLLKNYYKTVWLIPIPENGTLAKTYEKQLGQFLLENNIPILNIFSH